MVTQALGLWAPSTLNSASTSLWIHTLHFERARSCTGEGPAAAAHLSLESDQCVAGVHGGAEQTGHLTSPLNWLGTGPADRVPEALPSLSPSVRVLLRDSP